MKIKPTTIIILALGILFFPVFVFASNTSGTINSANKYGWTENLGWLDFGTSEGNVNVTDSSLTGYAWGENIGWVSLNCSNDNSCATVDYSISNDGAGALTGYAWTENAGWLQFNPTYGGVSINSSGDFSGYAWGENVGWIVFNCATANSCATVDYKVNTDWRPQSARPQCNNSSDDDGDGLTDYPNDPGCSSLADTDETDTSSPSSGGGGAPAGASNPPSTPASSPENPSGELKVTINNGADITLSPLVTLSFYAGTDVAKMAISNFSDLDKYPGSTGQIPFSSSYSWNLCEGRAECLEGAYTVYVKFYTKYGQPSQLVSDSIVYQKIAPPSAPPAEEVQPETLPQESEIIEPEPEIVKQEIPKKPVIKRVGEAVSKIIPDFLKPKPKEEEPEEKPLEQTLPKQAPQAMKGDWSLLPESGIKQFVFEPLPEQVRMLAQKFPNLGQTFAKLGITKFADLEKLKTAKLTLPGLTKLLDLPQLDLGRGGFTLPKAVPIAKLSASLKQEIPTEIVFAKTGDETIDLDIDLTINEQGQTSQKITSISGQPLKLIVKPEAPVKSIKGYLILTQVDMSLIPAFPELSLADVLSQAVFAKPVLAHAALPSQYIALDGSKFVQSRVLGVDTEAPRETRLMLQEFEYTDKDGDGIYTAEIAAPVVAGEYEIITLIDYQDINLGTKEIRLITVIDPEGYVYEKLGDKETRIPGAITSLYWLNPQSKKYEEWPASEFQQENPQITNNTGKYSFLVPEGSYYLNIEAPGYETYQGKPFQVKQGAGIHTNIELKTRHAWLKAIDWKIILLVVVVLLLLYNFYRDKLRERRLRK